MSNEDGSLYVDGDIGLYGGFPSCPGDDEDSLADRDWGTNTTTIDGSNGRGTGNNAYHVVRFMTNHDVVLDGFTIKNGLACVAGSYRYKGAGLYLEDVSSATVANCTFQDNYAVTDGSDYGCGGAIYARLAENTVIEDCVFEDNRACANIAGTSFGASNHGGAIYTHSLTSTEHPEIRRCTFTDNKAGSGGAISGANGLDNTIVNCVFHGNTAENGDGGAIYSMRDANYALINCTFYGNTTGDALSFENTTPRATVDVVNCIFDDEDDINLNSGDTANITATLYADVDTIGYVDAANGDFHLQSTSDCIDAGDDGTSSGLAIPTQDIEGTTRPIDGNDDNDADYDIGAYEYDPS